MPLKKASESAYSSCKNIKNARETANKICSVNDQGVIIDCQVKNWFSKFHSGNMLQRDEPSPEYFPGLLAGPSGIRVGWGIN